jgi:hypothetical protein
MPVEVGGAADGLAGVIDDEVQPLAGGVQMMAERFNAGRVTQVEAEDLQPVRPVGEVRF